MNKNNPAGNSSSNPFKYSSSVNLDSDLLLAPIKSSKQKEDSIYRYLRTLNQKKADYETVRLLYVAITRAKQSCHLIANVEIENDQYKNPTTGSLLHLLWAHWQLPEISLLC